MMLLIKMGLLFVYLLKDNVNSQPGYTNHCDLLILIGFLDNFASMPEALSLAGI